MMVGEVNKIIQSDAGAGAEEEIQDGGGGGEGAPLLGGGRHVPSHPQKQEVCGPIAQRRC